MADRESGSSSDDYLSDWSDSNLVNQPRKHGDKSGAKTGNQGRGFWSQGVIAFFDVRVPHLKTYLLKVYPGKSDIQNL